MQARRIHSGSTNIVSRGVTTRMPAAPTYPPDRVVDRTAEMMPTWRIERARRDAFLTDETCAWRYSPRAVGEV